MIPFRSMTRIPIGLGNFEREFDTANGNLKNSNGSKERSAMKYFVKNSNQMAPPKHSSYNLYQILSLLKIFFNRQFTYRYAVVSALSPLKVSRCSILVAQNGIFIGMARFFKFCFAD